MEDNLGIDHPSLSTARALGSARQDEGYLLDMICVGFGPASLAIAIALADAYSKSSRPLPKVLFIEKQETFAWHSGMQIPSAKMQISFIKDLATPRDPTSPFTFINYLHSKGRLNSFINLGTFLPSRVEYEDYMRWCAEYFRTVVKYGRVVLSVEPDMINPVTQQTKSFQVRWLGVNKMEHGYASARHVVVAAGGKPYIPEAFRPFTGLPWFRVSHSSQYAKTATVFQDLLRKPMLLRCQNEAKREELAAAKVVIHNGGLSLTCGVDGFRITNEDSTSTYDRLQRRATELEQEIAEATVDEEKSQASLQEMGFGAGRQRFAIVGAGQSAAEIFNDLWTKFPHAEVYLIIKDVALRPSDDSPFVNKIFDPESVDDIYYQDPEARKQAIDVDRRTNYGVVRLELLENIYQRMYIQRVQTPDPEQWRCKILSNRKIVGVELSEDRSLLLNLAPARGAWDEEPEKLTCSHVFAATGYIRNAHEEILKGTRALLPAYHQGEGFPVGRDYRVEYDRDKVEDQSGVWLQGCNESTHGLSDTLLSILAVRGGKIVSSIFGDDLAKQSA